MSLYYNKTLYPLQDKVLAKIQQLDTRFYLTGGTALSRAYFQHRYSDDLDFFVNQEEDFSRQVKETLLALSSFNPKTTAQSASYYSIIIDDKLKVEFVNDTGGRLGEIVASSVFKRTDSWENILANKLTAIMGRDDPKDVVDLWVIAKHKEIDWPFFFEAANSKAVGIFPPTVAKKIDKFPIQLLNSIKWMGDCKPQDDVFCQDIDEIIEQML